MTRKQYERARQQLGILKRWAAVEHQKRDFAARDERCRKHDDLMMLIRAETGR